MNLPAVLNVQPCLYQEWADNPSTEEDADPSNLLQFHSCLTYEGDVVVDSFVGFGTTAVAAKRLNRRFVGCDEDEAFTNTAIARLPQEL
jgi:DNA modification methylase